MNDKPIRVMTAASVLLVAVIAAVVSFVHIEHLAITSGQTILAAYLLPVSIDGTVVAASMVMLRAARAQVATPWLARVMLGLAVTATLAANVAYGAPHGLTGALISGWPAVAFIGCAEMAIGAVRRIRPRPSTGRRDGQRVANGQSPQVATRRPVTPARTRSGKRSRPVATRPSAADTEAAVLAALATSPDMTNEELGAAIGASTRTARRYRGQLAKSGHEQMQARDELTA